jgi:hypothetical protein
MGKAFVELFADDNRLVRTLNAASRRVNKWASNMTRVGVAIGAAAAAASVPLLASIKIAGDFNETASRFEATFADNADATRAWADQFSADVGRAKGDALDALSSFQGLFLGLEFDGSAAAEMSKEMHSLAIDFASFNNLEDEDAISRFISGLSGSSEVFAKFGINTKAAALDVKLLEMGFPAMAKGATEAQKTLARMAVIRESMGRQGAIGDAIATAGSFNNQMKKMQGGIKDTAVAIGNALLPMATKIVGIFGDAAMSVQAWAEENPGLIESIAMGTTVMGAAAVGAIGLAIALKLTAIAMGMVATVFAFVTSPIGLLVAALIAAGKATGKLDGAIARLMRALKPFGDVAKQTFEGIKNALEAGDWGAAAEILWAGVRVAFQGGINSINDQWQGWKVGFLTAIQEAWIGFRQFMDDVVASGEEVRQRAANNAAALIPGIDRDSLEEELQARLDVLRTDLQTATADRASELKDSIDKILDAKNSSLRSGKDELARLEAELKSLTDKAEKAVKDKKENAKSETKKSRVETTEVTQKEKIKTETEEETKSFTTAKVARMQVAFGARGLSPEDKAKKGIDEAKDKLKGVKDVAAEVFSPMLKDLAEANKMLADFAPNLAADLKPGIIDRATNQAFGQFESMPVERKTDEVTGESYTPGNWEQDGTFTPDANGTGGKYDDSPNDEPESPRFLPPIIGNVPEYNPHSGELGSDERKRLRSLPVGAKGEVTFGNVERQNELQRTKDQPKPVSKNVQRMLNERGKVPVKPVSKNVQRMLDERGKVPVKPVSKNVQRTLDKLTNRGPSIKSDRVERTIRERSRTSESGEPSGDRPELTTTQIESLLSSQNGLLKDIKDNTGKPQTTRFGR